MERSGIVFGRWAFFPFFLWIKLIFINQFRQPFRHYSINNSAITPSIISPPLHPIIPLFPIPSPYTTINNNFVSTTTISPPSPPSTTISPRSPSYSRLGVVLAIAVLKICKIWWLSGNYSIFSCKKNNVIFIYFYFILEKCFKMVI